MPEEQRPRFDEAAALAELERLRDDLERAQKSRLQKSEAFEQFIRSFRSPSPSLPTESDVAGVAAPDAPSAGTSSPVVSSSAADPVVAPSSQVKGRSRWRPGIVTVAIILVLVAMAMAVPRRRSGAAVSSNRLPSPPAQTPGIQNAAAPPPASQPVVQPVAPPVAPPEEHAAVEVELTTLAPVWIRVVVDGEKKVEALIPATQRLSFTATRSIVVRAGNGGDVLVKVDNHEDKFGVADQPLTRTFVARSEQSSPKR